VTDLKAIQDRVELIARHALPAIVNIVVSDGQGSGVIVSKDGYVLTAGHVSGTPNQPVRLRLSNGTVVDGVALGNNNQVDSGMVKITTPGDYPCMPVGTTRDLREGQWVMAMGHPGGFQTGRPPVVRLGKALKVVATNREWFVQSDCPLIMGDSGGPVFDLNGYVIGINSKIGLRNTSNVHVPIDAYTQTWERLAKGDEWGNSGLLSLLAGSDASPTRAPKASLGTSGVTADSGGVIITHVSAGKAADRAGVLRDDVLTKVNGQAVKSYEDFVGLLSRFKPGESVRLELLRDSKVVQISVVLDTADSK
jgi:serine protease Do